MSARGSGYPERVPAIHLAISGAAIAFVAILLLHIKGGISEKEETRVFMLSCILVPVTGIVLGAVFAALKRRFFAESTLYWPLLALANAIFWIVAGIRIRAVLPPPKTGAQVNLGPFFAKQMIIWAALNVALLAFFGLTHRTRWSQWIGGRLDPLVERLLPFLVFGALLPYTMHTPPVPWRPIVLLAAFAALATGLHRELFALPQRRSARIAFDLFVIVALYFLATDPGVGLSTSHIEHHNFYLGPAAAVRAGKSLLVDVNCQYGVGNIYLLAALMRFKLMEPSMFGLAYIVGILAFLQYVAFYASLRMATRSVGLSALVTAVALVVATFEQAGFQIEYPSTGGIRFLPGYLFVLCIAFKARFPRHARRLVPLEAFVVGGASVWSFEAFVYVLVAYLGSLTYDLAHSKRGRMRADLRARVVPTLIAVAAWHVWLAAFTRYRSGEWPHWSYYIAYIRLYSVQEFGTLPIEPYTPWLIIGGVYAVVMVALGYRRLAEETTTYKPELAVVFTMAALGIGQYTYFLGRSHFNNLFHICLPAFFVAGFMFIRAAKDVNGVSRAFRRSFVLVGYAGMLLCFFSGVAEAATKFEHTRLAAWIHNKTVTDAEPIRRAQDAVDLLRAHAPQRRVAFFSAPDIDVQVFLLTRKANIYPIAYQVEDNLVPAAKQRIFDFDDHLKPGDIVFIDTGTKFQPGAPQTWDLANDIDGTDKELWKKLQARFSFEVVEERKSGIVALRLKPR